MSLYFVCLMHNLACFCDVFVMHNNLHVALAHLFAVIYRLWYPVVQACMCRVGIGN